MEGMILAAGLGTRLRPLTDSRPKALVEVGGRTLLQLAVERLAAAGVEHVVVNVHHFADMVEDYLGAHRWPCRISVSDERALLLDTGGALRHAAPLFAPGHEVVVHNVDVLSTIDLRDVVRRHREQRHLVTLCVSRRPTRRLLSFTPDGQLDGRCAEGTEPGPQALAFSGVSVVGPDLFDLLPPDGAPFPVIDEYIRLAHNGHRIGAYLHEPDRWLDVGKPETLKLAEQWIASSYK